jgi:hypothetical protein
MSALQGRLQALQSACATTNEEGRLQAIRMERNPANNYFQPAIRYRIWMAGAWRVLLVSKLRAITSATVTMTFEFSDLGVFGPGSIYAQAKDAAIDRINQLLEGADLGDKLVGDVKISAISTTQVPIE